MSAPASETPAGLTPTEFARYQRSMAKGELYRPDGSLMTEAEWLEKLDGRRSRVRGMRKVTKDDGQTEVEVVGQKVFLPNIIIGDAEVQIVNAEFLQRCTRWRIHEELQCVDQSRQIAEHQRKTGQGALGALKYMLLCKVMLNLVRSDRPCVY